MYEEPVDVLEDVAVWSKTRATIYFECGDEVCYADEIFLLRVMRTQINQDGLAYDDVALEDGSDLLYEPIMFCFGCWETILETLHEGIENSPPIEDHYGILECSCCSSSIRNDEILGVCTYGEMHLSKRAPSGVPDDVFESTDPDPSAICIGCLNLINQEVTLLWGDEGTPEVVQQFNECMEGIYARCWRSGCCGDESECGGCK